ncbi:MAG TPA: hypothetical protein VEB43_15405 [Anaeromyxobacter sp.]|nr:hypothetical protein [Anaeromyxobacter sp.]
MAALVGLLMAGCASFPERAEPRGPTRAAAPTRPAAPIAGPPDPAAAGTGAADAPARPLAVDRDDERPAREVLAETDAWLLELPRLHGLEAQWRASDLLANFATLARRLDRTGTAELVGSIEEDARALGTDPGWFGRTDLARSGLRASAAALDRIAEGRAPELRPWVQAASDAAEAIRSENPFGIERSAIQDAFRAVADAFRAAIQRTGARPQQARAAPR